MTHERQSSQEVGGWTLRFSQDFAAGVFLMAIALFAAWQGWSLPLGTLRSMGPGMLPMTLAALCAAGGLLLVVLSMAEAGDRLEAWSVRGLFFIIGGIVIFALTIQSLGLIVAGPAAMVFGSMASPEFRWLEAVIFSVVLTAICILLFKTLLGLPIPVVTFW
jgi:putative tricarboxylic transport membrane protein